MSMIGNYIRIKREQLEEALQKPGLISELLYSKNNNADTLEVDKAWHGIHFLLTGDSWAGSPPFSYVVLGGQPLGDEDMGYGPPHYITPEQVKEASHALSQINLNEVRNRYNPEKFEEGEIYPGIWDEEGKELEYLLFYLNKIIAFFKQADDNDEVIIFWIN